MVTKYPHEMYKNCFEMSIFKDSKFLVINYEFDFLLHMNIYFRPRLYIVNIFHYIYDYIVIGINIYTSSPQTYPNITLNVY